MEALALSERTVSPNRHRDPVADLFVRMHDDAITFLDSTENLRVETVALPHPHIDLNRPIILDFEKRPTVTVAEQGTVRHLQDIAVFPQDEAGLDTVAVAENLPLRGGRSEINDDPHALFFNA